MESKEYFIIGIAVLGFTILATAAITQFYETFTADTPRWSAPISEDESGNGNDLSINGNAVIASPHYPKFGHGIFFDGATTYLESFSPDLAISGDLTIFAVVDIEDMAQGFREEEIAWQRSDTAPEQEINNILYRLYLTRCLQPCAFGAQLNYFHEYGAGNKVNAFYNCPVPPTPCIIDEGDHTLTLRRTLSDRRVVVRFDGTELINQTWSIGQDPTGGSNGMFRIGSRLMANGQTVDYFNGTQYETRIWNSALTTVEIEALENTSGSVIGATGETALWRHEDIGQTNPPGASARDLWLLIPAAIIGGILLAFVTRRNE